MDVLDFAKKLLEIGDREGAIKELSRIIRNNPNEVNAWILLAQAVEEKEKKVDCYRQVLRINPNNEAAQAILRGLIRPLGEGVPSTVIEEQGERKRIKENRRGEKKSKTFLNKTEIVFLLTTSVFISCLICLGYISIGIRNTDTSKINTTNISNIPIYTPTLLLYSGNAQNLLPRISEMPQGYTVVPSDKTGWIADDSKSTKIGSFAFRSYVATSMINKEGEINGVLFAIYVFNDFDDAKSQYKTMLTDKKAKPYVKRQDKVDEMALAVRWGNQETKLAQCEEIFRKGNVVVSITVLAYLVSDIDGIDIATLTVLYKELILEKLH